MEKKKCRKRQKRMKTRDKVREKHPKPRKIAREKRKKWAVWCMAKEARVLNL
jgi:hypothetical protein